MNLLGALGCLGLVHLLSGDACGLGFGVDSSLGGDTGTLILATSMLRST